MIDSLTGLVIVTGVFSFLKGLENINPKLARSFLKRRMEQPDYFFTASGLSFVIVGLAIIYLGLT
ncbi:MAG: hypothetical protein J7L23_04225 [Candidatus Diapherotrites archaeon]|nr:hypothetical protein [Candidatus Diapherotrites archaeon]